MKRRGKVKKVCILLLFLFSFFVGRQFASTRCGIIIVHGKHATADGLLASNKRVTGGN
jgi:hypothetical protein